MFFYHFVRLTVKGGLHFFALLKSLDQWFPTFSVSWTVSIIWMKAVDFFIKTSQYYYLNFSRNLSPKKLALLNKNQTI